MPGKGGSAPDAPEPTPAWSLQDRDDEGHFAGYVTDRLGHRLVWEDDD